MSDLFGFEPTEVHYGVIVRRNGDRHVYAGAKEGAFPVPHDDPDLLRWMGEQGHSLIEEVPVFRDDRDGTKCQKCGSPTAGVDEHHWLPKEWVGEEEAESWPKGQLCRTCHERWHHVANRHAAKSWARICRERGRRLGKPYLSRLADQIEASLEHEDLEEIA